ncbi:unnamed protein product [Rotaria sordida]|uniref:Uncharacterized protein n=1 Tax=Rotaria sordida TaxID=392033 RepID=A0A813T325_9BILA|nr:unnamed protein product [Rotaria sordida]CAF1024374.1 unnamed protein product [Rotaria sordida]
MTTSNKATDQYNDKRSYVAKDLIWKDHISKIETAQRFYDKRWGFLNETQPPTLSYNPKQSSGSLLSNVRSPVTVNGTSHHEDVKVSPSPRPIPSTTNKLIGWRTADKNYKLIYSSNKLV